MKLSNKKDYDISAALVLIAPNLRASVWLDGNGVGEIKAESGTIPIEADIDEAGLIIKAKNDANIDKAAIVDSIATATITTTAGNVFKCDGKSQSDLTSVIVLAQIKGLTETEFKPKSSPTLTTLPLTELIEAGELIEAEIKTIMRGA